jgi:hypothetical protein
MAAARVFAAPRTAIAVTLLSLLLAHCQASTVSHRSAPSGGLAGLSDAAANGKPTPPAPVTEPATDEASSQDAPAVEEGADESAPDGVEPDASGTKAETASQPDTSGKPEASPPPAQDGDDDKTGGKPDGATPGQTPGQNPGQTPGQTPLPPLTITAIRTSGAGCPTGNVATNVSPDQLAFTLILADFFVEYRAGDKNTAPNRSCNVQLDLAVPAGQRLTLLTLDHRGHVELDADDHATLATGIAFAAAAPRVVFTSTLAGPISDDFTARAEPTLATGATSGCGGTQTLYLDLNASIAASGASDALLTVDSVDGELHQKLAFAADACP